MSVFEWQIQRFFYFFAKQFASFVHLAIKSRSFSQLCNTRLFEGYLVQTHSCLILKRFPNSNLRIRLAARRLREANYPVVRVVSNANLRPSQIIEAVSVTLVDGVYRSIHISEVKQNLSKILSKPWRMFVSSEDPILSLQRHRLGRFVE